MITNEEWKKIQNDLDTAFFTSVYFSLKINDTVYKITVRKEFIRKNTLGFAVIIDGRIELEYVDNPTEVVKQVWRKVTKPLFTAKDKKVFRGIIRKNTLEKEIEYYVPVYFSVVTLIRQFKKIEHIEMKGSE